MSKATLFREKSDYVDFYIVTREESEEQINTAKEIVQLVDNWLKEENK